MFFGNLIRVCVRARMFHVHVFRCIRIAVSHDRSRSSLFWCSNVFFSSSSATISSWIFFARSRPVVDTKNNAVAIIAMLPNIKIIVKNVRTFAFIATFCLCI